ncbi:hypothetical protein Tco_0382245 [Tanacetum coccineum]
MQDRLVVATEYLAENCYGCVSRIGSADNIGNEIAEVFRIETDVFLFETPLCKELKKFNHLLQTDVDVLTGDL